MTACRWKRATTRAMADRPVYLTPTGLGLRWRPRPSRGYASPATLAGARPVFSRITQKWVILPGTRQPERIGNIARFSRAAPREGTVLFARQRRAGLLFLASPVRCFTGTQGNGSQSGQHGKTQQVHGGKKRKSTPLQLGLLSKTTSSPG